MSEIAELMKRCQRGVGGRNALDEAHDIMAECYGALGKLEAERDAMRQQRDALAASVPAGCKVVPVELLRRLAGEYCDPDCCIAYWRDELRALLASDGGVKDE